MELAKSRIGDRGEANGHNSIFEGEYRIIGEMANTRETESEGFKRRIGEPIE